MTLSRQLLEAPDREAVRRIVGSATREELDETVEKLAEESVRLLRVDARHAFRVAETAETAAADTEQAGVRARALWVKGHAFWGVSRIPEALECYRDATRIYDRLGRRREVSRVAIGEVNALSWLGRYDEALQRGEAARRDLQRDGEAAAAARLDLNLGNIYHWSGRPRDALKRYDRALRAARRLEDDSMVRMIQMNRATQISALGRLADAERLFREIVHGSDAAGETRHRAIAEYNLGYILFQKGDYGAAFDTLDRARMTFEELHDDLYLAGTRIDLAELFLEVNDFRRARRTASAAGELASRLGLRFEMARSALLEAIAALAQGAVGESRRLFERARETFREEGDRATRALCDVYLAEVDVREGNESEAMRRLRRAIAVFQADGFRAQAATASLALAALELDRGRPDAADSELQRTSGFLRGVASPWLRARLAHQRGRAAAAGGDLDLAVRRLREAVRRIEGIRGRIGLDEFRVSFSEDKAPVYADLIDAILRRAGPRAVPDAFAVVERARSRSLVDLLAGRLGSAAAGDDEATARLLRRVEALRAEINRLSGFEGGAPGQRIRLRRTADAGALRECEAKMTETLNRLQRRNAHLGALAAGETMSLAETQRTLPEETTLVEYFVGEEASRAFVVTRDSARMVRLDVGAAEIVRRSAQLRFQIEKAGFGSDYERGRADVLRQGLSRHLQFLADRLWDPLGVETRRVSLVPHGALHTVPFAAMPSVGGGALVDRFDFTLLPSASCRRYLAASRPPREPRLLAVEVGDADIPEVAREVRGIRELFPRGVRLGPDDATHDEFRRRAEHADIIHVATHGLFRGDDPLFSGLQLADGWFSVHDVYGLRLRASLVCLSACQTGRSLVGAGDELVGLSRGFLYAGARDLVVSLWPVPDGSTADLMVEFYKGLRDGKAASESLGDAMRAARDAREHPYFWAPFVLIGA